MRKLSAGVESSRRGGKERDLRTGATSALLAASAALRSCAAVCLTIVCEDAARRKRAVGFSQQGSGRQGETG